MALHSILAAQFAATYTAAADLGVPQYGPSISTRLEIPTGIGNSQNDRLWAAQRTLVASVSEDLDLSGVFVDVFGVSFVIVEVASLTIKAAPGNTNDVVVGGAPANPWVGPFDSATYKIHLPPGGMFCLPAPPAGWPVTPGTADLLRIANGGAGSSVVYQIAVTGRSA